MQKSIDSLEKEFSKLRTGRASTALVDSIRVVALFLPISFKLSAIQGMSLLVAIYPDMQKCWIPAPWNWSSTLS